MRFTGCVIIAFAVFSCKEKPVCEKITVDKARMDSAKEKSDTNYIKRYRSQEFVSAEYYINHKDTTVCQIIKDSAGQVRQVIMAKKNTRFFTAEYYPNGQLKADLPLDKEGKYDGTGIFYYENGCVKSTGAFHHGFYAGEWKNYTDKQKLSSTDQYDPNGQLLRSIPAR